MDFRFVPSDCVLWQGVMAWLVNREMAVLQGRLVKQVCNWKETVWYENHMVRIESQARDTQPIRGVRSSLMIQLARGFKRWNPLAPGRRYGARRSPLSKYMSLHLTLKLTKNCGPLSRIKWERYIFLLRSVFRPSIIFMFLVGSMRSIQHIHTHTHTKRGCARNHLIFKWTTKFYQEEK